MTRLRTIPSEAFEQIQNYPGTYTFHAPQHLAPTLLDYVQSAGHRSEERLDRISFSPLLKTITISHASSPQNSLRMMACSRQ